METLSAIFSNILEPTPGREFAYQYVMIGLIILLFAGAFALRKYTNIKINQKDFVFKNMFRKVPARLHYFAIGLIFLTAVRYENIPYFAMRLWLYMTLAGLLVFLGRMIYKYIKVYPKELANFKSRQTLKRPNEKIYLPNKKK
jgi:hypothetical protein